MADTPFLAQIALFSFNFAPQGWATCSGQLLPINQNQALFSLLGTMYGGNGQTNFALPDLRSRVPLGLGQGPGASYLVGEAGGAETVTLAVQHLPAHGHTVDASALTATVRCSSAPANQRSPAAGVPAVEAAGVTATYSNALPDANMKAGGVAVAMTANSAGGGQPHDNRQPYLGLTYCIALQGIFPSQN
jgi:microcystin-dependent protein